MRPNGDQPLRKIIHVDMDAFFASVEQRDNPELRGRPVAVGRGKARGVVAAASYEARRFGVKSAMPSLRAARACPDLVFVAPRFEVYRAVSAQIHAIFSDYTDLIEPLSLDEAYLDVSEACAQGATATGIAEEIRARILETTRLTGSAGVSYNKFLAKLASDQQKPNGLTVIRPGRAEAFVASLPVGRFHGVGPVTEARMKSLGIETGADLQALDMDALRRHFGSSAEHYHLISRGIDERPVRAHRERKSVGAETTFETDRFDLALAQGDLGPIAEKVARRAEEKGVAGYTVTLKIKFADFEQITRQRTLPEPVRAAADLARIAGHLLEEQHPFRGPVRLLGISLSGLEAETDSAPAQPSLFDAAP
ncbi:DNA polymerase IV [Roseivivax halodurans JCM 10272]|uniref:DNA polymerase IV n=1 Tax=Roseivivax halodurans JCM 10272 TaxID=1449350 RepID=X7EEL4_9RHOB|nr:DNA polymerase IV [Roseivivax halodurans]ETX13563.1 DNA polymerase IV [Roseivivax halodurans JCM 10272]